MAVIRGAPSYMVTFGDMMSLLLTFFVMLLTMANFEPVKFKIATESLQGAFGILESYPTIPIHPFIRIPKENGGENRRKNSIADARKIEQILKSRQFQGAVKVEVTETGIAILLQDPVTFPSGSADLKENGVTILSDIATIIKSNPDLRVRVEGHTDDVPIQNTRYRSNWELSSARALSVVQLLATKSGINPANMSAVGYGEYKPVVPNTDEQARAKNRRIQIFVDYTAEQGK
jgi:chemotaxis protein MotB